MEIEKDQRRKELALHLLLTENKTPEEILKTNPDLEEFMAYPVHYSYIQQVSQLNFGELWKNVTTKVLFIYGTSDFVTSEEEHRYAVNVVNHYHPGQASLITIDNMDHGFAKVDSPQLSIKNALDGNRSTGMNGEVLDVIMEWLAERLISKE